MKNKLIVYGIFIFATAIIVGGGILVTSKEKRNEKTQETSINIVTTTDSSIDEINKEIPLSEKNIVNFGDSIIGMTRDDTSISNKIQQHTLATTFNVGFGGTHAALNKQPDNKNAFSLISLMTEVIKDDSDSTKWLEQTDTLNDFTWKNKPEHYKHSLNNLKIIDFSEIDIITISFGTNDFAHSIPIEGNDDYSFSHALAHSLELVHQKYPEIKLVLITPIYRYWKDDKGIFLIDSNTKVINDNKLDDFSSAISEIAKLKNVSFIDNSNVINFDNKEKCFPDNDSLHPNEYGRELMAKNIVAHLDE